MKSLAPIILFVYNRPWHTQQTVEALQHNELANESELYIYSDASKTEKNQLKVQEVRAYIYLIGGFKKVTIIEREKNWGLANSIIDGVTNIINQYGRVIVLEDDIVTSPSFLVFMNTALNKYLDENKVWHISGWNYPVNIQNMDDTFFWRVMNCWGWATWADRWQYFEKDAEKLVKSWNHEKISCFNLDDGVTDFWAQVKLNHSGKLNTWAIFWYASIFERNGLCLNPTTTLVNNIGLDGSGENCGKDKIFLHNRYSSNINSYPKKICESSLALQKIKQFYKDSNKSWLKKITAHLLQKVKCE